MSYLFKTWDEIADYVTSTKGYEYLDNPKGWIDAFKDAVGDTARYVGENTYFNPNGYSAIENWLAEGQYLAPAGEGGLKSIPTIKNIITDAVGGGTVAGASAVATETVGISIELSVAGLIATGLVGLGLGVASYELAPEFWTDASNAIFEPITGEHLTPEQTEPFLRRKLKTLLATDDNNHIVTYVDRDMMERMYNFIQTHIQENGWDFYDNFTWTATTDRYVVNYMEYTYHGGTNTDIQVKANNSLSDEMFQSCIHQVQLMMESKGYTGSEPSAQGIVNNLRSVYPNYGNATFYQVNYVNYYTSPTVQTRKVQLTGYICDTTEDNEITARLNRYGSQSSYYYRYLRMGVNQAQAENNDYATEVNVFDANGHQVVLNYAERNALFTYEYDIDSGVGTAKDDGSTYIFQTQGSIGLTPVIPNAYQFGCKYLTLEPRGALDNYLLRAGAEQKGKIPPRTGDFEHGYSEWFHKNKTIGTPTKDGTNIVSNYIPANLPMTPTDTDKIINNGVNKGTDSYNDNQDTNQNGQDTPNKNPVNNFNENTENNIKDYNDSNTDPNSAPDPAPQPLPDYPETPPTDTEGDTGDTPTTPQIGGVTASGMVSVYNPTKQQLIDFSAWLWSPNFLDNFLKIFANPMDAIIGLHIMYATPVSSGSEHIIAGYLDSGVSSKVVTQQYSKLNCGTVNVPEYYGNATDYEPYTTVHIYLPFIGIMPLRANDVLGKQVKLEYGIDALTGTCLATITSIKGDSEIACYTFAGNCAVQIPVSGGNYAEMIKALSGFIVAGAGAIATGNPVLGLGAGVSFMSGNTSVQHSGSIGSNAGACGIRKPYLIITRKKAYDAQNYQHYYGFPANNHVTLNSCKGYTQVKSCHVESIYRATDNEKQEIESLLKEGVIIV